MAKGKKLFLLTALTTVRDDNRVRFGANTVQTLTGDEIDLLDKLEKATGKPQYRTPRNESAAAEDEGDSGRADDNDDAFDGESVEMDEKTSAQLRAYLDANEISYEATAKKPELLKAAKAAEADKGL